jgi:hypothetical protein
MPGNISRRWIAGKGMKIGDEIKAVMLSLHLQVLPHSTEVIANMKPSRWLYS